MRILIFAIIGYLIGCINPAYILSQIYHVDIQKSGTGNLGTTNAFINFGKGLGMLVFFFDLMKGFIPTVLCIYFLNMEKISGIVMGCGVVLGHMYPFYKSFHGGKGVASLGGVILALDWRCFLFVLCGGFVIAVIMNYGCFLSFTATLVFPFVSVIKLNSIAALLVSTTISLCVACKHGENIKKIHTGEEPQIRRFLMKYFLRRKE